MSRKKLPGFILFSSLIFLLGTLSIPILTSAAGMLIEVGDDGWDYSGISDQQAFINYKDGIQEMAISIGIEDEDHNDLVWIFPVPANPKDITADIMAEFPCLISRDVSSQTRTNLGNMFDVLRLSQIYPVFFGLPGIYNEYLDDPYIITLGVFIHNSLEKEGMTLEVITARRSEDLLNYLESKGTEITSDSIPILDNYIGKEYSFIVSWINPIEETMSESRGVFVTFPTSEIYFPMSLTSVYGDKIIPITMDVSGNVSPKIFENIKDYSNVGYHIKVSQSFPTYHHGNNADKLTESLDRGDYKNHTTIWIEAPSKLLTEDLWISSKAPPKVSYQAFFTNHPIIAGIILLILSSMMASLLSGLILFKDLRRRPIKLILIGLSNLFTIVGVIITVLLMNTKENNDEIKPILTELKQKYLRKRRVATILFSIAIPALILVIIKTPVLWESLVIGWGKYHDLYTLLMILMIYILPLITLIGGFLLQRVKAEDRELFDQLESSGYSTWSLQSKDRLKFAFVPLFSVSFLAILWSLTELIKLTI